LTTSDDRPHYSRSRNDAPSDSHPIYRACRHRTFVKNQILTSLLTADFVQELYLKELKAYKVPAVKEGDSVGQVQTFSAPSTPKSPEEGDLAGSLKEYETMAVEIEGQDASAQTSGAPAALPDWLETEEEEEAHH
jgi:F-type H+-transporting ATPase subunit h